MVHSAEGVHDASVAAIVRERIMVHAVARRASQLSQLGFGRAAELESAARAFMGMLFVKLFLYGRAGRQRSRGPARGKS